MGSNLNGWTLSEKKTAMDMAANGHTSREIAATLGRSRAAVIGYCARNEIKLMGPPANVPKKERKKKIKIVAKIHVNVVYEDQQSFDFSDHVNKTFMEIKNGECKSIIGDAKGVDTLYCARPVVKVGCDWCAQHYALYYNYKRVDTNGYKQNHSRNDRFFAKFKV